MEEAGLLTQRLSACQCAGGHLYLMKNGGMLTCLDARTGGLHYRKRIGERIMATPALLGGKVYVRTEKALHAFGTRARSP